MVEGALESELLELSRCVVMLFRYVLLFGNLVIFMPKRLKQFNISKFIIFIHSPRLFTVWENFGWSILGYMSLKYRADKIASLYANCKLAYYVLWQGFLFAIVS